MNKVMHAKSMATDQNYCGVTGMAGFTIALLVLSFGFVEAGKFAMTAFLGA